MSNSPLFISVIWLLILIFGCKSNLTSSENKQADVVKIFSTSYEIGLLLDAAEADGLHLAGVLGVKFGDDSTLYYRYPSHYSRLHPCLRKLRYADTIHYEILISAEVQDGFEFLLRRTPNDLKGQINTAALRSKPLSCAIGQADPPCAIPVKIKYDTIDKHFHDIYEISFKTQNWDFTECNGKLSCFTLWTLSHPVFGLHNCDSLRF